MRHQSENIALAVANSAMFSIEPFGFASGSTRPLVVRVTQDHLLGARSAHAVLADPQRNSLRRAPRAGAESVPFGQPWVNGESATSTRVVTMSQTKWSERFRTRAPGQQAGFAENLKSVADPDDQLPGSRLVRSTLGMIGEKRAIAPQRR